MTDHTHAAHAQMMYDAHRKSVGVAYLLWFFLGGIAVHRFYAGKTGTAIAQLFVGFGGWIVVIAGGGIASISDGSDGAAAAGGATLIIGLAMLAIWGLWLFIDIFLIPGMIRDRNMRTAASLTGAPGYY